jgi:hypothetical protein
MNIYFTFLEWVIEYLYQNNNNELVISSKRIRKFLNRHNLGQNFSKRSKINFLWRINKKLWEKGYLRLYTTSPKRYKKSEKLKKMSKNKLKKELQRLF